MTKSRLISIMVMVTLGLTAISGTVTASPPTQAGPDLDAQLAVLLAAANVAPPTRPPEPAPTMVSLGEALFWDPILSGNRDIACASCHHPLFGTGDGLSLSFGTGATGVGPLRVLSADGAIIARNAPSIFNRGDLDWTSMFWDSRVAGSPTHGFSSPAGNQLPAGLDSVLAVQAMFPPTSTAEMRGSAGDVDVNGNPNELALLSGDDLDAIWDSLMARLMAIPAYEDMFAAAYPTSDPADLGFQHAANAIAAYETYTFSFYDSPWDNYLAGNTAALSDDEKRGAILFYGAAGCARCHSGPLMTDQAHHNVAVPPVGPGIGDEGLDVGRMLRTDESADRFAFRTAPLRNVAVTGPWMHNGAYTTLEGAVRHMLDPVGSFAAYQDAQLDTVFLPTVRVDQAFQDTLLATLDRAVATPTTLTDEEFAQLMAFLYALTSPSALDLSHAVVNSVPSDLATFPVESVAATAPVYTTTTADNTTTATTAAASTDGGQLRRDPPPGQPPDGRRPGGDAPGNNPNPGPRPGQGQGEGRRQ